MPLQATSGAASYDAFGGGTAVVPAYIEEVFGVWLHTGTGATQTITNGIDLSTKGGLVWIKGRSGATGHRLTDTARGATKSIESNAASAEITEATGLTAFGTTGFTIGADADYNTSAATYASWSFRKQPKFFDVVTYTGDGTTPRSIPHNLGSTPACVMIKMLSTSADWYVYHRGLSTTAGTYIRLNSDAGTNVSTGIFPSSPVNSTAFKVGSGADVNGSGSTYVAYVFAHNAGGFGLTGTDNVISCGEYTGNASETPVTLGYEPQWVMIKSTTAGESWHIFDNMRNMPIVGSTPYLFANSTAVEATGNANSQCRATSTGFIASGGIDGDQAQYIYIAIRRGPMRVPTDATKVFGLSARTGTGANATVTGGQIADSVLIKNRGSAVASLLSARLTGTGYVVPSTTAVEVAAGVTILQANPWDVMDGVKVGTTSTITNASSNTYINYLFKRSPSFMDICCYKGTGSNGTITHNLGAVPELIIVKRRNTTGAWEAYSAALANTEYLVVNTTAAKATGATRWNSTSPTSSVFSLGTSTTVNASGGTYEAHLFSTCTGVSKVGSYTGNGTSQTINCGFTAGARFVLMKRTDAIGNWAVWDTARGMVAGNDPFFFVNTTSAEFTSYDDVDTDPTGFIVNFAAGADMNASGGTYIFLAIA